MWSKMFVAPSVKPARKLSCLCYIVSVHSKNQRMLMLSGYHRHTSVASCLPQLSLIMWFTKPTNHWLTIGLGMYTNWWLICVQWEKNQNKVSFKKWLWCKHWMCSGEQFLSEFVIHIYYGNIRWTIPAANGRNQTLVTVYYLCGEPRVRRLHMASAITDYGNSWSIRIWQE